MIFNVLFLVVHVHTMSVFVSLFVTMSMYTCTRCTKMKMDTHTDTEIGMAIQKIGCQISGINKKLNSIFI
jgi:hypothetical protein